MRLAYSRAKEPRSYYIQKSYRDNNGVSRTKIVERLGTLDEIKANHHCEDPLAWAQEYVSRLTREDKESKRKAVVEFSPVKRIKAGEKRLCHGGDMLLLPIYNRLGLNELCAKIVSGTRAKYDLAEILRTLVLSRALFPCSKLSTHEQAKSFVRPPGFGVEDMYRALSVLSDRTDDIQAEAYRCSGEVVKRDTRVIYYDCTNYFFETESEDATEVAVGADGKVVIKEGLRRYGKSKEHRPSPIVQVGLFMDYDGIPLAMCIFPGNASEQQSMQPLEEMMAKKFGITEFVVSTDAGLGSEENRRYNMTEGRSYICVQSIKKLSKADQEMALKPQGWRVYHRRDPGCSVVPDQPDMDLFDLDELKEADLMEKEMDTVFYKEIIATHDGRQERVIVTYSYKFEKYQRKKRAEQIARAKKMVESGKADSRTTQQDARRFVKQTHVTRGGEVSDIKHLELDTNLVAKEEKYDGFYAYGSSLDDHVDVVMKARGYHHEIEHMFRTTKTLLEARPVYLQREDRIKSHFLVCYLALLLIRLLQVLLARGAAQTDSKTPDESAELKKRELRTPIDRVIASLRSIKFTHLEGYGYIPSFERTELTDNMQELFGLHLDYEIISDSNMKKTYKQLMKIKPS